MYLDISLPTLKSDIERINDEIKEFGVVILSDKDQIKFNDENKAEKVLKIIDSLLEMPLVAKMQLLLLLKNETVPLQQIADVLYVSKSKIVNAAKGLLQNSNETVYSTKKGYRFTNCMRTRTDVFIRLLTVYFKGNNFENEYKQFCKKQFNLSMYITGKTVYTATDKVHHLQQGKEIFKNRFITRAFLYFIFILSNRPEFAEGNDHSENELGESLHYKPSEFFPTYFEPTDLSDVNHEDEASIVKTMLNRIDVFLGTGFSGDEDLIIGLRQHIDFRWNEYYDIDFPHESLELLNLKNQFPLSYEAALIAAQYLNEIYQVKMDAEDVIYLSIHFQNSIEREKRNHTRIRAVILTPYGQTAGELIKNQLLQKFENVKVLDITSYDNFVSTAYDDDIDLILSLSYIEQPLDLPVIYLPLALGENNYLDVENFMENKKYGLLVDSLISDATVIFRKQIGSKEEAIDLLADKLFDARIVTSNYKSSVLEREAISSTSIKGIAVPHGNIQYVHSNRLGMLCLDEPIKWGENEVDKIFMLAINEKTNKANSAFFNGFYRLITKRTFYVELSKLSHYAHDKSMYRRKLHELFIQLRSEI